MDGAVVLIRHGDEPDDDRVATHLQRRGITHEVRRPWTGQPLDDLLEDGAPIAGLVVYGGGFDVRQTAEHPFLVDEHRLIERCLTLDVPVLGLCQGAQSMASVLGATVGPPGHPTCEFGMYEVRPTPASAGFLPGPLFVTQAHFHEFATPAGAVNLAVSDAFGAQAFQYGARAYGLQFHPEVTIDGFRRWQDAPWAMYDLPGAQPRELQDRLLAEHDAAQGSWFDAFLLSLFT